MLVYYKMTIVIALSHSSITAHNYHFFTVVRTLKIYSLSKFQVYNTLSLTIITKCVCVCVHTHIYVLYI